MKSVRSCFTGVAFLFFALGFTLLAYFFAKPILSFIHNFAIGISYIVAVVYLAVYTGVLLSEGRTNQLAKKYKSYQELDLASAKLNNNESPTDEDIATAKKKAYESSSAVWFYMLFIWLTPLLCAFHEDFRFYPMNLFNLLALASGLYIWIRHLIVTITRFGDSYTQPIAEKAPVGWFVLKCITIAVADMYYIAVLLVAFGVFEASTFVLAPR